MKLTEYQKGFLDAFLDARGHIYIDYFGGRKKGRDKYYPIVNILFKISSMWVLEKVRYILGIRKSFNIKKGQYALTLGALESEELLKQVTLIKGEHRRLVALEIIEIEKKWDIDFQDEVKPEHRDEIDSLLRKFYIQGGN